MKINLSLIYFCVFLSACTKITQDSTNLTRNNQIKPILGCGVQCLTIKQGEHFQQKLTRFLKDQDLNKTLILANCRNRPTSPVFMEQVAREIFARGISVAKAKAMLPYEPIADACLMLVRGPVILYPPRCISPVRPRGAYVLPIETPLVGDDFACYSQQNLSYMIDNPSDLQRLSGFSGQLR